MSSVQKAKKLFKTFHQYDPREIGAFPESFSIPTHGYHVGEATEMLYTSDKLNPETGEDEGFVPYFHEHEGNVKLVLMDGSKGGEYIKIPKKICEQQVLTYIGDCDGYSYVDEAMITHDVKGGRGLEWFSIPQSTALLVIQGRKKVKAILWGGGLRIEWRGVVG